jgi:hypothetical protein
VKVGRGRAADLGLGGFLAGHCDRCRRRRHLLAQRRCRASVRLQRIHAKPVGVTCSRRQAEGLMASFFIFILILMPCANSAMYNSDGDYLIGIQRNQSTAYEHGQCVCLFARSLVRLLACLLDIIVSPSTPPPFRSSLFAFFPLFFFFCLGHQKCRSTVTCTSAPSWV